MKRFIFISALTLQFGATSVYSQVNMSDMELVSVDSLQKSRIRYFTPGLGGRNRVWDFSKKLGSSESSQVMFMKDSTDIVSVIVPGKISYYHTTSDTLILIGSESPLEKREYVLGKFSKKYPLEYGDSVSLPFRCKGVYCGNHLFREAGTTTVKVDAEGSIVLADNDTIRNVRRVHTIDSYSICMDLDSAALDTAKPTQIIDERYEWYLPDSHYPIIETVINTSYSDMEVVGTIKYAYCNLPDNQVANYITPEDENEMEGQEWQSYENQQTPDIFHYEIEILGKEINITYDLDEDATITTIVANQMGMLCMSRQWTQNVGQGYSTRIACNGLHPGIYILYINVNGKVYSEIITL